MNEFDDPQLERMLGRASGAYPDDNVAYEVVRVRVRQVKRRRAMVASTAACALLFGLVTLAVRGGGAVSNIEPGHGLLGDHSSSVHDTESTDATDPTEASTLATEDMPDTSMPDVSVVSVVAGGSMTGSGSKSGGHSSGSGSESGSTESTLATVTPVSPQVTATTFSSKGGSVMVQVSGKQIVLVGDSPEAGFTMHVTESGGDRLRVEFTNGHAAYEIQLELSEGKLVQSNQNKG